MIGRRALSALAASLAATVAFAAAAAGAGAALVEVRVATSAGAVLFDGTVETAPHLVDGGDGSGAHPCDGGGTTPLPTATGALDDALRGAGITWRGGWDPSFGDFFIDRIGPYASAPPDQYWSLAVNGRFSPGGCLATVADGALVSFEFGSLFGEPGTPAPGAPGAPATPAPPGGGTGTGPAAVPSPATHARVRAVAAGAAAFLRRHRGGAGASWGRLALALRRGRGVKAGVGTMPDGRGFEAAAAALLGERLEHQRGDGSIGGDVNATAVAVLALGGPQPRRGRAAAAASVLALGNRGRGPQPRRARAAASVLALGNRPPRRAAASRWLVRVQRPDGGFGIRPGISADVDTTALAGWALARAHRAGPARRAAAFVAAAQSADGGFPSFPGGESNAQSTGLALVALRVAGPGPRLTAASGATPLDYLASLARPDGSIEYAAGSHPTPVWTTAQALLGLTARGRLLAPPRHRTTMFRCSFAPIYVEKEQRKRGGAGKASAGVGGVGGLDGRLAQLGGLVDRLFAGDPGPEPRRRPWSRAGQAPCDRRRGTAPRSPRAGRRRPAQSPAGRRRGPR